MAQRRWSPDAHAASRVVVAYRPLDSVLGLFLRLRDGTPGILLADSLHPDLHPEGESRRRVVLAHELGHFETSPPSMGVHLGSRRTVAGLTRSSWAPDRGDLHDQDDAALAAPTIAFACDEPDIFAANRSERQADRWAMRHLMPEPVVRRWMAQRLRAGGVVDEEAIEDLSAALRIEFQVTRRWLAVYEALDTFTGWGSNYGTWDCG